jgi:Chromo (CHRromatin Organisation MOdifier) domain
MVRNKTQYLVKWKGYPIYESTWEPEENVQGSEAIEDFSKLEGNSLEVGRSIGK